MAKFQRSQGRLYDCTFLVQVSLNRLRMLLIKLLITKKSYPHGKNKK